MAVRRKEQGSKALGAMYSLLRNNSVPSEIRRKCLIGALIPVLTFGGELWGQSILRADKPQRVLDKAARLVTGTKKEASLRMMEELDIENIYSRTSRLKIRARGKYLDSRTWIGLLARNPGPKNRKWSWVSGSTTWERKYSKGLTRVEASDVKARKLISAVEIARKK